MLYLPATILISSFIVIVFKYFGKIGINNTQAIIVNYLVTVICGLLSLPDNSNIFAFPSLQWFPYAIIAGFTLMLTFQVFALSSQKAGVAVTAVFSKMSLIIPVGIGMFFYNEQAGILKIIGILITLLALYLTIVRKKEKSASRFMILPLILFFGNGLNDSLLNHCEKFFIQGNTQAFLTIAFASSLVLGIIILTYKMLMQSEKLHGKSLLAGILLGLLNWYSTFYFLKGMRFYESVIYFPVLNIGIVLITAISGFFIFREKLSKANIIGIAAAIVAIVLISMG